MIDQRNVLTIATGKQTYYDMAINLARSFYRWNRDNGMRFFLVTDMPGQLPHDLETSVQQIILRPGEKGYGFSTKLHLDELAPAGRTLFVDSDCLVYGDLSGVFDIFSGHPVAVLGTVVSGGDWFGDIAAICEQFSIKHMPKFNGGIYYLEKSDKADQVYQRAREIEKKYDEIGFKRLRDRPNDEVIMSLSMALNKLQPVTDDGTILSDLQACRGHFHTDVLKGKVVLENLPAPHPDHQEWYPFRYVSPLIVHFLGHYTDHYEYQLEAYRLRKAAFHRSGFWSDIYGIATIALPKRCSIFLKDRFRPLFRRIFGVRKIKSSQRI